MGGRKAEKSADYLKIRDAEGRIVTFLVFLEISLCASTRGLESSLSAKKREASSFEDAFLLFRENINRDSNAVNKTTRCVVLER